MEGEGIWNDDLERDTRDELRKAVLQEFSAAEKEKKPPLREMFNDVFEKLPESTVKQKEELKRILETYPAEYDIREFEDGIKGL